MIGNFSIHVSRGEGVNLNAIWDNKLKITREIEQGQQFFRNKIDGTLSFVGDDFDKLASASLEDTFDVAIWHETGIVSRKAIQEGYFNKTDIEFDYDNKIASTKIKAYDRYQKILDHLEDEIDVLSLGLPSRNLTLDKRAILQLYMAGTTKVTHVIGNQSYDVDAISGADTLSLSDITNKKFSKVDGYIRFDISYTGDIPALEILSGSFLGKDSEGKFWREDREYYYTQTNMSETWLFLYDKNDNPVRFSWYICAIPVPRHGITESLVYLGEPSVNFVPSIPIEGSNVTAYSRTLYARILQDRETEFKEADFQFTNFEIKNYRYVQPAPQTILEELSGPSFIQSFETTTSPTKWGRASNDEYFTRPQGVSFSPIIPVGWDVWGKASYWVQLTVNLDRSVSAYDSTWVLRDAYPLVDVIKKLLEYLELEYIEIDESNETSEFFFGDSSLIRSIFRSHVRQDLFITPVTNIEKTFYDTAARKMTLSLGDIFSMLKNCFNVYWDLYRNPGQEDHLRFEHLAFYENGGSYDLEPEIIFDLQRIIQPLTKRSWAFGQNKATYDVSDLPSRYEFSWSSECTDVFDGFPIQILNSYVASNSKEEISIAKFFSDVDLIMSTPDSFSDDAIVILGSTDGESVSRQRLDGLIVPGLSYYYTQNGYLSLTYLEGVYHRYSLSGDNAIAEDIPGSVTGEKQTLVVQKVKRFKKQTIRVPYSPRILTEQGNIKTPLGIGIPQKISYELDSCIAEIELLQEN